MLDRTAFFRNWVFESVRASMSMQLGQALTLAMTREISPAQLPVIELGPGTFARQLVLQGVPEARIAVVENSGALAGTLRREFPAAALLNIDVADLRRCDPFDGEKIGAIISALPLMSMPTWRVFAILYGAFRILRPEGAFYQVTYGWRCPIPDLVLQRVGLEAVCAGWVIANAPPAHIYRVSRKPAAGT